jgi:hypothetical protein
LGFYICYLIIFVVHSVNCSYTEDFFFIKQRANSNKTSAAGFGKNFFKRANVL